ncbi:MAG: hypothetical protein ACK55I_51170, partial [bacterium]
RKRADAAVALHDEPPGLAQGLPQEVHHPLRLGAVHLKKGVWTDLEFHPREGFEKPVASCDREGVGPKEPIAAQRLEVEAHAHHLRPASHPAVR